MNERPILFNSEMVRAMDKAASVPEEKQQDYRALVNGLVEQAEAAHKAQRDTWDSYAEAAKFSAEKPVLFEIPQCQCEGCKLIEENNRRITNPTP